MRYGILMAENTITNTQQTNCICKTRLRRIPIRWIARKVDKI